MGFQLPRLTTEIDCGPIGYPGLVVTCWLNVTYEDYKPPEKAKEWETQWFYGLGRILEAVTFPATMTDSGEPLIVTLSDARAVYDLAQTEGFDQQIINWALEQYRLQRQARLEAEAKN
jgi:hypothetical protein